LAFDSRPAGPARLAAVVAAWLDHVAADPHAHRTLHFSAHLLPPEQREAGSLKHRLCLETAYLALTGAAPALAERPDLTEPLLGTMRALLDDPTTWPEPESLEDRTRRARRVTGMLVAATSAETAGVWLSIGPTEPASSRRIECSQAQGTLQGAAGRRLGRRGSHHHPPRPPGDAAGEGEVICTKGRCCCPNCTIRRNASLTSARDASLATKAPSPPACGGRGLG
jgi:hypothetical protein